MKKRKILFVMMNLYNGGAEKSFINLTNELNLPDTQIDLLLFQKKGMFLRQLPNTVNLLKTPDDLRLLYSWPNLGDLMKIKNWKYIVYRILGISFSKFLFKNENRKNRQLRWKKLYDRVLSKYYSDYDLAISYIEGEPLYYVINKVGAEKKYVWIHNDYTKLGLDNKYDQLYLEKADKIISISKECVSILKDIFPTIRNKCIYIPNINSPKMILSMVNTNQKLEFNKDKFKILSVGRLTYQKGFDIAVETAKILKENGFEFQWLIIGDGKLKKNLNSMIKKLNLEDSVRLLGTRSNPYIYMDQCDILVQTSRFEGKSVVLDEAKILNKPILATNYKTITDQLSDDIGFIVGMDPKEIASVLIKIIKDKSLLKEKVQNLKKIEFNNEDDLAKYKDIFEK